MTKLFHLLILLVSCVPLPTGYLGECLQLSSEAVLLCQVDLLLPLPNGLGLVGALCITAHLKKVNL